MFEKLKSKEKVSLIVFLFSFILIIYLDFEYIPTKVELKDISISDINKFVRFDGDIIEVSDLETITIIKIRNNNYTIEGIIFENETKIEIREKVEFIGKVGIYKNKPQIIIYEIIH